MDKQTPHLKTTTHQLSVNREQNMDNYMKLK